MFAAPAGAAEPTRAAAGQPSPAQGGDFAGRVELAGGRRLYLECRGQGRPTVILVSGYPNRGDVWSQLDPGVRRPPVLAGVARYSRVCAYDRPNTVTPGGDSLALSRSDPVPQPRTAAALVAELHALLRAARLRGSLRDGRPLARRPVRAPLRQHLPSPGGWAGAGRRHLRAAARAVHTGAVGRPRADHARASARARPSRGVGRPGTPASTRCWRQRRPGRCGRRCRWSSSPHGLPAALPTRPAAGVSGCGHARAGVAGRAERAGHDLALRAARHRQNRAGTTSRTPSRTW